MANWLQRLAPNRWNAMPFVVEEHCLVQVVRDDLVDGGSKMRFLPYLVPPEAEEVVFGGPFCGGAPVALATFAKAAGIRATIFYAKRFTLHRRQLQVLAAGSQIHFVPYGRMANVQAKARAYAAATPGAFFLPLGFDLLKAEEPFIAAARLLSGQIRPIAEIWCAAGSGMLARCLALAFPEARICAVAVGLTSRWAKQKFPSNVRIEVANYRFDQPAAIQPPFPSCPNYDAKAWERCAARATTRPGARVFWNVMG